MTPNQILLAPNYRQFPRPSRPWLMYQEWSKVLFLHAPVPGEILLPLIPRGTVPDLYLGQAWVSILVFTVRNAHPRFAYPLPYLSNFHEINLRTYVRSEKTRVPGITFLDIHASRVIPSLLGRAYGLPYRDADIFRYKTAEANQIVSRKEDGCTMDLSYTVSDPLQTKKVLDIWLTERYIAYQQLSDGVYSYPIQHREWPLKNITVEGQLHYKFGTLELNQNDMRIMHYAENVQVLVWNRIRNDYSK